MELMTKVNMKLSEIYSEKDKLEQAQLIFKNLLDNYSKNDFKYIDKMTQNNVFFITYGDSFSSKGEIPLSVLNKVVKSYLGDVITDVHILPMFPYTSDDGFSVVDYLDINPDLGSWKNIEDLSKNNRLMFDFVANHMSKSSQWFQSFINHLDEFDHAFIHYDALFGTTQVVRPRTSPLFHSYINDKQEEVSAWTTFSEDQVDVNVKDPVTLGRLTHVLLEYAKRGATSIRLDAIGFLWKESGTSCMSLPQTHAIVQLWRSIVDEMIPNLQIVTETNVPHQENISYFGDFSNEATLVYQFPLPPLTLFSFIEGNAVKLKHWAKNIEALSGTATYFNFLASHDGIGLRPTEGILTDEEREKLVSRVLENEGKVSYKTNPDGTTSVYEMNINYSEALRDSNASEFTTKKMIAAHHILLSVVGVPAIYYHSIFGSKNDTVAVTTSGINRRINREKLDYSQLADELQNNNYRTEIYHGICELIKVRQNELAFDPYSSQKVLDSPSEVFAIARGKGLNRIDSYTNVSSKKVKIENVYGINLINDEEVSGELILGPYEFAWIKGMVS